MSNQNSDEQKVWEAGRYFSIALGSVPNSFSTTIRTLLSDHQANATAFSNAGRFLAQRLARSQSIQAKLQFAALTLFPEDTPSGEIPPNEFLTMFGPYNFAALLGTIYTYRKCKRRCNEQEFGLISKTIQDATEVGAHLGLAIPRIGLGNGLIAGAFSILSICPFMLQDLKGYKEHKRKVRQNGLRYSLETELEHFHCTHAHVCSWILPPLGFGVQIARSVTEGFLAEIGTPPAPDQESYLFYVAMIWIEALLKTGQPPEITHRGGYYPMKADMDRLLAAVADIRKSGSKHNWLDKGKDDQVTGTAESEDLNEEIPEDIQKEIQ